MKHFAFTLIFAAALFFGFNAEPAQAKGTIPTFPRTETPIGSGAVINPADGLIVYKGIIPTHP